jgi:adenosylhomocysteine nucleosidase
MEPQSVCGHRAKGNAEQKLVVAAVLRCDETMILHGDISLDRPLLVVALEEEAKHLHVSELPILVTGIGKVCAASSLAAVVSRQRPSRIVNLGTAGALREGLAGTHVVGRVFQHDFDDAGIFALTGEHFGEPVDLGPGPVLASGDVFVSGGEPRERLAAQADLVDMEGYALARVARGFGLPVSLVKEVSDSAGQDAAQSWTKALDDCAERLGEWVRRELLAA